MKKKDIDKSGGPTNIRAIILSLMLVGCQASVPIVDNKNLDTVQYNIDLQECKEIAGDVKTNIVETAAGSATIGAILGAILGAAFDDAAYGAAAGAITYGAANASHESSASKYRKKQILDNCLIGRGYNVLG